MIVTASLPPIGYLLWAVAFLLGSIPTGWLVARAMGVDILKVGSGNMGATNVFRILGKGPGILVLLVDALKGYVAARWLPGLADGAPLPAWYPIVTGFIAILGHNYTPWLGFRGGKGIATSAGVLAAVMPRALLIAFGVWAVVFGISRYVSLASVAAAVVLPVGVWLTDGGPGLMGVASCMSILAIYKHRANIRRLLQGTENRIGKPKPGVGASASETPP